ncbi:MAG TPA: TetR/AcrR family transcriptional regulator [Marmoricola sp.]|nr:TetR/AcrR family transcriptional regulator [Marmoricola sp.]
MDATRDAAFRQAALELLAEVGYERLTIDAVAARAQAGKPTIYRRWPGKAELVVDALNNARRVPEIADTGSLRGDLAAFAASVTNAEGRFGARLMIGMVNALSHDADLRRVFSGGFVAPRTAAVRVVFERAVARGEMSGAHDLDLIARILPALALQQLVTSGQMPTAAFVRRVIDEIVYPLATAPQTEEKS